LSNNNEAFENAVRTMMKHVGEDPLREGLLDTPQRVRKSYEYIYGGYKEDPEAILKKALFTTSNDEMVLVKDIEFYSTCEHHLLPIIGRVHVAYIPDGKVSRAAHRADSRCYYGYHNTQRCSSCYSSAPYVLTHRQGHDTNNAVLITKSETCTEELFGSFW